MRRRGCPDVARMCAKAVDDGPQDRAIADAVPTGYRAARLARTRGLM